MEKSSLGFLHRYLPALAGQDVPHLPFARCTDGKHDAHSTHVSGDQMSSPGCCFSLDISSTTFSLISLELFHITSERVVETTYLGRLFMRSANPCSPVIEGQALANPS